MHKHHLSLWQRQPYMAGNMRIDRGREKREGEREREEDREREIETETERKDKEKERQCTKLKCLHSSRYEVFIKYGICIAAIVSL